MVFNEREQEKSQPVQTLVSAEYAAAMQRIASKFDLQVSVKVEGEKYWPLDKNISILIPSGKAYVTIIGDPPGGLTKFYEAARHEQEIGRKQ